MKCEAARHPAYGEQMAEYFRLTRAPSLVIHPSSKPHIAITHLVSEAGLPERTASIPPERAFVVSIHLTPAAERGCDIWVDDRHVRIKKWPPGGVGIYDLESNPRTRNPGRVDWVHYHVPRAMLDAFTDDAEASRIQTLECVHGRVDPALHQMTEMMLPSVDSRNHSPSSFWTISVSSFARTWLTPTHRRSAPGASIVAVSRRGKSAARPSCSPNISTGPLASRPWRLSVACPSAISRKRSGSRFERHHTATSSCSASKGRRLSSHAPPVLCLKWRFKRGSPIKRLSAERSEPSSEALRASGDDRLSISADPQASW